MVIQESERGILRTGQPIAIGDTQLAHDFKGHSPFVGACVTPIYLIT